MIRPTLIDLRKVNKSLQPRALENYLRVLTLLCKDYPFDAAIADLRALIERKDFDGMLEWADSISSQSYDDRVMHFTRNQFVALIKKYPWEKLVKADPRASALIKFRRAEHKCRRVNAKFRARRSNFRGEYEYQLEHMRHFIAYVLGYQPNLDGIYSNGDFGPGASIGVHGQCTNSARKILSSSWTVTPGAYSHAYVAVLRHAQFREVLIPEHGGFWSGNAQYWPEKQAFWEKTAIVSHNKITLVPKTAKVHRTIAIEPLLNGYLQKGVDVAMRLRLKRVGIDLSDQTKNQEFARKGSIPGEQNPFVTIDLSAASDSIATEMVREILPPEWFDLLNSLRSPEYELDGEKFRYHKFCSMGNGFCFPLETLVFAAACTAVGCGAPGKDFLVYGDDIIVRQDRAEALIALLSYLGFKTNSDKTFLEGPFRESCGSDWYDGHDVRPTTLDFALNSVQSIFKLLNLSQRNDRTKMFFFSVRPFLLSLIPSRFQFFRPQPGNADTGIDSTGDEHLKSKSCRWNKNLQAWTYMELVDSPVQDNFWKGERQGHLALLWGALVGAASTAPFVRRRSRRTKIRFTAYSGATSLWTPAVTL